LAFGISGDISAFYDSADKLFAVILTIYGCTC
jgi:hypothetical protein